MATTDEVRARLRAHFENTPDWEQAQEWSKLWDRDFLPWDRGMPNPALEDTLKDRSDLLGSSWTTGSSSRRKRALVPGCGRGYDVLLLASFGYDAYGLDISSTAIAKCQEFAREHAPDFPPRPEAQGTGKVAFLVGDFFQDGWLHQEEGGSSFDLIYDYTVGAQIVCILLGLEAVFLFIQEYCLLQGSGKSTQASSRKVPCWNGMGNPDGLDR